MNTFKFNFSGDDKKSIEVTSSVVADTVKWLASSEIIPSDQTHKIDELTAHAKMFTCGDIEIGHVITNSATLQANNSDLSSTINLPEQKHSDLITGIYEGGLKIWECTSDLIEYIEESNGTISFENKKVLDLGCGAGILGIYALMKGSTVTFQDYNKEVIEHATIPNVLLNIEEDERESEIKMCKFFSGDWASFNEKCNEVYDIILTSETIYNECNYTKLLGLFCDKLTNEGVAYVAAKTYYFGVGGGTRQFEQSIKNYGTLESEVCWKNCGGIQREIIKITKKL